MISNIDRGKEFEAKVAELFRLTANNVTPEILLGSKRVDILVEYFKFNKIQRVAIECKNKSQRLSRNYVSRIASDYQPLLDTVAVTELLIITMNGISPAAEAYIRESRHISHLTYSELLASIMDFSAYLHCLVDNFEHHPDHISKLYIPLLNIDNTSIDDAVLQWLYSQSSNPIAILGTYGMGKTTFSHFLAHTLAKIAQQNSLERIPILIRLADISSEQSLEGLLGRTLTVGSPVKYYSFDLFMHLNRLGRFAIILDGFDEMKHGLTWDEFRYNFSEFNRLITENSKVIVLGRPTAFLSDEEHLFALHGKRKWGDLTLSEPNWPDFQEMHIRPLTDEAIVDYLERYYEDKYLATIDDPKKRKKTVARDVQRVLSEHLIDIARRPVQLKMLAEVLPDYQGDLSKFNIALLYSIFIERMIDRDAKKSTRSKFSSTIRGAFARDIAWWLWREAKSAKIWPQNIPDEIVLKYCGPHEDISAAKRDLFSGSILSRRLGASISFPHRSFQEFLVAERALELLRNDWLNASIIDNVITDEVATFMSSLAGAQDLKGIENLFKEYRGPLSWRFILIWTTVPSSYPHILKKAITTNIPWYSLIYTLGIVNSVFREIYEDYNFDSDFDEYLRYLHKKIMLNRDEKYVALLFLCAVLLETRFPNRTIIEPAIEALLARGSDSRDRLEVEVGHIQEYSPRPIVLGSRQNSTAISISLLKKMSWTKRGLIDIRGIFSPLSSILGEYCCVKEWLIGSTLKVSDVKVKEYINVNSNSLRFRISAYLQDS
ncbi:MAG: NACHT domain-containing protein [Deltaproteobacteria bacterium]|nr:NACHT domain-containing protein [Deltaproteobacteria bacterium]